VYSGGPKRPPYVVDDLVRLLSVVDTAGRSTGRLCDGVILTEYLAVSGRYYMPWLNGQLSRGSDWELYLDSLSAPGGILTRLEAAVVRAEVGRITIAVMVPYPDAAQQDFTYGGRTYDLSDGEHRAAVVEQYIRDVVSRVTARRLPHLVFYGFYWLNEAVLPADSGLVARVTKTARGMGYGFLWIPSWGAAGAEDWRSFGFDEAWQQPNYFFHPEIGPARLDSAISRARGAGMGLELEFDRRLFSDTSFRARLGPYLDMLGRASDLRSRSIAIYEGGGALIELSRRGDAWHRELYGRLVAILRPGTRS
jgi:uncharacterized protein DUF4855